MTPSPTWLNESGLQQFFAATKAAGGEARVVGGAVRDFLAPPLRGSQNPPSDFGGGEFQRIKVGLVPPTEMQEHFDSPSRGELKSADLDLASTVLPEQTIALAAQQGWKTIPTGIAHGTVTVLLPERAVEVTTLRRDVATDGRHATVAFTDNWQEDAARRDFTINAMSIDAAGKLYDYFNGAKDLAAHRVVFIGDAATRITEDGLRILRFFRFLASHGQPPADTEALRAITEQKSLIAKLSGERIATEMKKMLQLRNNLFALQQMQDSRVFPYIFGDEGDVHFLEKMLQFAVQHNISPSPWLCTLALMPPVQHSHIATWVSDRWKLSRAEQETLAFLAAPLAPVTPAVIKELLRHHPREKVLERLVLAAVDCAVPSEHFVLARSWQIPEFPIAAKDLLAQGFHQGKALGDTLRVLESAWAGSDYTLTRQALLERARP